MKTLRISNDGNVMMVQRLNGIAVSAREPEWNARGRVMVHDWKVHGTGLDLDAAEALFHRLAA